MSRTLEIKEFIVREFAPDLPANDLADDHDLLDGAVVDSLGLLKLIAWLETRYGIDSEALELDPDRFRTVTAIDALVDEALARVV
ncbi:phosphopantetheine-binding protein [Spongiactinospora sp. 9N601]|uniref:phosphopantetheine-binding protein n=1 Tax=Spongiactinospora sp. 9N601 TaxID=3375149 RepID=UPI0037B09DEF